MKPPLTNHRTPHAPFGKGVARSAGGLYSGTSDHLRTCITRRRGGNLAARQNLPFKGNTGGCMQEQIPPSPSSVLTSQLHESLTGLP